MYRVVNTYLQLSQNLSTLATIVQGHHDNSSVVFVNCELNLGLLTMGGENRGRGLRLPVGSRCCSSGSGFK